MLVRHVRPRKPWSLIMPCSSFASDGIPLAAHDIVSRLPLLRDMSPQSDMLLQRQIGQSSFVVQLNRLDKRLIRSERS